MASKKLYIVKKEHILEINEQDPSLYAEAMLSGYTFIKDRLTGSVYMLNTTSDKESFDVNLVNVEIVD